MVSFGRKAISSTPTASRTTATSLNTTSKVITILKLIFWIVVTEIPHREWFNLTQGDFFYTNGNSNDGDFIEYDFYSYNYTKTPILDCCCRNPVSGVVQFNARRLLLHQRQLQRRRLRQSPRQLPQPGLLVQHAHPINHGGEFQRDHARPHGRAGFFLFAFRYIYIYIFIYVSRLTVQVVIYSPNRKEIPEGIHGNSAAARTLLQRARACVDEGTAMVSGGE